MSMFAILTEPEGIFLAAQVFQAFGLETLAMRSRRIQRITRGQSRDGGVAMKETAVSWQLLILSANYIWEHFFTWRCPFE